MFKLCSTLATKRILSFASSDRPQQAKRPCRRQTRLDDSPPKNMDIEEIDNSSQEALVPPATTTAVVAKKKRTNKKKSPPAVAPPSTLARFLGPAGPPSRSAWEDVNRQCPVCQQTGFSSRSLALHVNDCLDERKSAREAASSDGKSEAVDGTARGVESEVGNADSRNAPKGAPARGSGKVGGSSNSKAAGTAIREGHAGGIPREAPSNASTPDCTEEQRLCPGKAAKKTTIQQDWRAKGVEKSDVVALFVVLYEVICGRLYTPAADLQYEHVRFSALYRKPSRI